MIHKIDFNTHLIQQNKIYFEENCTLFNFIEELLKINQDLLQKNEEKNKLSQNDFMKRSFECNREDTSRKKSGKVATFITRKNLNILKCITPTFNRQKIIFDNKVDTPCSGNNDLKFDFEGENIIDKVTRNVYIY